MIGRLVGLVRSASRPRRGRRRWTRWIGRGWARVSYGYRVEPTWLELNRYDVPVEGLPPEFAGFRVVQLSDFHCGRQVTRAYVNEAVDLAQAQDPDLIVLTGDFVHRGYKYIHAVTECLGRLSAPHGVYAVLGNHDFSVRNALGFRRYRHLHRAVADALSAQRIRVLQNEAVRLIRQGAILHLIGVQDLWSRVCDIERAFQGVYPSVACVVLAHNPRTLEWLDGRRCDLMLSGHTHGGQVNLPGLGRPALGRRTRRFAAGMYRCGSTHLYVNKGIGFGFRFRYGARPEVAVLTLKPV